MEGETRQPPERPRDEGASDLDGRDAWAERWNEEDRARREFQWFGTDVEAPRQAGAVLDTEPDDQLVSPWAPERDALDEAAIAALVAGGMDPTQARERVEAATDRERFERAVARGVNAEDATAAVEGARLLQRQREARHAREVQQQRVGDFIAGSLERAEVSNGPSRPRPSGDIAADTGGELIPRFDFVNRRADRLAIGDLLYEPHFGEVRVSWIVDGGYDEVRHVTLVQVFWNGDDGSRAARAYRPDERLVVRLTSIEDAQAIERAIERARYRQVSLDDRGARLIAAHLQGGPGSGLYRLAVTGEVSPTALEELEVIAGGGRAHQRRWTAALRRYCQEREDGRPLPELRWHQW